MVHAGKEFPKTSVHISAILPKFGRSFDSMTNYVNNEVFNLCLDNQKMEIYTTHNFAINHYLNYDFFWKDKNACKQHRFATTSQRHYLTCEGKKK